MRSQNYFKLENEYYSKYENDSAEVWEQEKSLKTLQAKLRETETERVSIGHKYRAFKKQMLSKIEGMVKNL